MNKAIFTAFLVTILITNCASSTVPDAFLPPITPTAQETITMTPAVPDNGRTEALPCECSTDAGTVSSLSDP